MGVQDRALKLYHACQSPTGSPESPDIAHLTHQFLFCRRREWSPLPDLALPPVTLSFLRSPAYRSTWISLDLTLHYVRFKFMASTDSDVPKPVPSSCAPRRLLLLDLLHRLLIAHACAAPIG